MYSDKQKYEIVTNVKLQKVAMYLQNVSVNKMNCIHFMVHEPPYLQTIAMYKSYTNNGHPL